MSLSPVLEQQQQQQYNPLTFEDILLGNKDSLFGQYNMDWKGNNEGGKIAKQSLQALWPVIAQRLASMNMMNPAVEQAIQRLTQAFSPEGAQTLADEQYSRLQQKGQRQGEYQAGRLKSAGVGTAAQEGARLAQMNQSTEAGNQYLNNMFSPEAMASRAGGLIDAQGNLSANLLQQMLGLSGLVEQRYQQNQQDRAKGGLGQWAGLLGAVGNLAGSGGLSGLFGGGKAIGAGAGAGVGGGITDGFDSLLSGSGGGGGYDILGAPRFG